MNGKNNKLNFSPGKILEEFDVTNKDGNKIHVKIRYPEMSDVDEGLKYINEVISESEFLRLNDKITRKEEEKWLSDNIYKLRQGKKIMVFVEIDGKISGSGQLESRGGATSHVGDLGIALREKYTNMGIGTKIMEFMMNESMKIGIEIVRLSHYEHNKRAKRAYEKLGFLNVGVIPKARKMANGKYSGESIMYKILVKK